MGELWDDWGSNGGDTGLINTEHTVGKRSTPAARPISRPDFGGGDTRPYREYKTPQRPFPGGQRETPQRGEAPQRGEPLPRYGPEGRAAPIEDADPEENPDPGTGDTVDDEESNSARAGEGVTPEQQQAVADYASKFLEKGGVSPKLSGVPMDWLQSIQANREEAMKEPVAHAYDLRHIDLPDEAQPFLTSYANRMAREGASEQEVVAGIELYLHIKSRVADHERETRNQTVAANREDEVIDNQHRDKNSQLLRAEWGADYASNVKVMNDYLDTLPEGERVRIVAGRNPDGTRLLNDPGWLRDFLGEALANQPDGLSRQEIEKVMKTNRRAYDADPEMQARYRRQLLRQGN